MKKKVTDFLRRAFPFLIVVGLWRLTGAWLNPGGILALIPIFFYTFIRPIPLYGLFGFLFCFLIDYQLNTLCLWTGLYCLFYAVNGFQSVIDLQRMDTNGRDAFSVFIGTGIILVMLMNFTFSNLLRCAWVFVWMYLLYFVVTELMKKVHNDD